MKKYFFSAIVVFCLVPTLFFPLSSDISIFVMAGKLMSQGGSVYKDFVDLKPPFFYAFYALIYKIFGSGEFALRMFDLIWQSATVYLLYQFVSKITTARAGLMAAMAYALSYTAIGYNQTMNAESWIGLPLIIIMSLLHSAPEKTSSRIYSAVLLAIFTAMKYTFGLLFLGYLLIIFDWRSLSKSAKNIVVSGLVFAAALVLCFFPLLNSGVFEGFLSVTRYLGFHSSTPAINMQWVKSSIINTGLFFGDNFSLLFSGLLFMGLILSLKGENYSIFKPTLIFMMALILSVIWERKFMVYHFSRAYLPFAILIGFAADRLLANFKSKSIKQDFSKTLIIGIMCVFGVMLSPLPRWANTLIPIKLYLTDRNAYNNFYEIPNDNLNLRTTYIKVAEYLNSHCKPNSKISVMGIGANLINYFTPSMQHSKFTQSSFYFGNIQMPEWKNDMKKEISNADVLVVQTDDGAPIIMGHIYTTNHCLHADSALVKILNDRFVKVKTIKQFEIYQKRANP